MINNTGYTPTYSAHVSDSALCATCHNLKTPFVDSNGDVVPGSPESEFPGQMAYTEWQNSIFDDSGSNPLRRAAARADRSVPQSVIVPVAGDGWS